MNHEDNFKNITSNVKFDFVGLTRRVESKIVTAMVIMGTCACGAVKFCTLNSAKPIVLREN